jgi:DNA helicase-2/ATP-dependent DNA helicase PcrA
MLVERLLRRVREFEINERQKEWVDQEIELLDNEVLLKVHNKIEKEKKKDTDSFYEFDREQELLRALVMKRKMKKIKEDIKNIRFLDVASIYIHLMETTLQPEFYIESAKKIRQSTFTYEDVTPFLYVKGKLEGFQVNTTIRHVFIDEAQDYSPFQFAFIKNMFPRAKLTVLGDVNQSIYAHSTVSSFASLESLFSIDEIEKYELTQSYRSTKQIINFAKGIIQAEIDPFNRDGEKPSIVRSASLDEMHTHIIERLTELKQQYQTMAVICKTAKESKTLYNSIKKKIDVRLIEKDSTGYDSKVLIIPSYLAKGVEFDAVLVYNASFDSYFKQSERKLLYTICTRAMHFLDVYFVKEISPLLENISDETFVYHQKGSTVTRQA